MQFGDCTLDRARRELRRGADLVAVAPRVFDLLLYLLDNRDRVVTRDEMIENVWGGRLVSESTLASHVNAARRAVGDSGEAQAVIKTLPRKGFRFVAPIVEVPAAAALAPPAAVPDPRPARRAGIAVMPFRVASARRSPLAEALAHDIIFALARLRVLTVIARGSSFALDERAVNPAEAGRMLGVDYVACGALRDEGPRVRIDVELIAASDGHVVWTETFEAPRAEVFAALPTLTARIVHGLDANVAEAERNRAILKPPDSLDAWEAYHRAVWHMFRFTAGDNDAAKALFARSVELDPTFSRAHAGLSFTHFQNAFLLRPEDRRREIDLAFEAAGRGVMADARDPAAHWAMGRALWLRREPAGALRALDEAVRLSPNFATAHYSLAFVRAQEDDPALALGSAETARALSPFDPMMFAFLTTKVFGLLRLDRVAEAAEVAATVVEQPNVHAHCRAAVVLALAAARRFDTARAQLAALRAERPGYSLADLFAAFHFERDLADRFALAARDVGLD